MIEISPVPLGLPNNELEGLVCKALSLTGNEVYPNNLEACHHFKKKENVIVKFKSRKLRYKVINNRKIMKNKSKEWNELKFCNNCIFLKLCVQAIKVYFSNVVNERKLERFSTHGSSTMLSMSNLI